MAGDKIEIERSARIGGPATVGSGPESVS